MIYKAFKRYINRESHSDLTNISDYKDFDLNKFKEAFKKVFEETKYEDHYKKMISWPCKPDCVKSSLKIRHNPLIYPHAGL